MYKKVAVSAIIVILLTTVFFASNLGKLKFNYVFEDFFPVSDPALTFYQDFTQKFENDNDYLLIGLYNSHGIFEESFLNKLDSFTNHFEANEAINEVRSLTNSDQLIISPAGIFKIPFIHTSEPDRNSQDSVRIFKQQYLIKSMVSEDGLSTAIVLRHKPLLTKEKTDLFVNEVIRTLDDSGFEKYHIAGKTYAQGIFIYKIQEELILFLSASVLLVIFFLVITYRSFWGVLIPLVIVLISTIWILGFMAMTNKPLDILMVLLPTIMFVVGMSDVVHLMTKYIENLRRGDTKIDAVQTAVKEVGMATFLTSLTTAVGFLTLYTATIRPIQEFGLYTALGVFMAFLVTFSLLPASMLLLKTPSISYHYEHRTAWFSFLSKSFIRVIAKRKMLAYGSLLVIVISLIGMSKIVINTFLIEDLPKGDPLKLSFEFFDEHYGGSRPFEVAFEVKDSTKTIFDKKVIGELEHVNNYLADVHQIGNLVSPNSILKGLNQALNGGNSDHYRLPETDSEWDKIQKPLKSIIKKGEFEGKLFTQNLQTGRITGKIDDIGSALSLKQNVAFQLYANTQTDTSLVKFTLTGTSNLIDKNNAYLAENMMQGLGIAFAVIAFIAGLLFRSFRMIIITLIPNIIPLMMVAAIMGYFGISLKLSTSIVFTIAFGISVDDTLHFISKLKLELNKGKTLIYALKRTYLSTGKAIIVTSIILSGGFLILILSSFGGTFYTGLLISLTLIFALVIDLTILPAFILLFYKPKQ